MRRYYSSREKRHGGGPKAVLRIELEFKRKVSHFIIPSLTVHSSPSTNVFTLNQHSSPSRNFPCFNLDRHGNSSCNGSLSEGNSKQCIFALHRIPTYPQGCQQCTGVHCSHWYTGAPHCSVKYAAVQCGAYCYTPVQCGHFYTAVCTAVWS
jgi:hypothetical protein